MLSSAAPDCLIFGTDLPSTRSPRPYCDEDLRPVLDALDEAQAAKVLYANAMAFYRPRQGPDDG